MPAALTGSIEMGIDHHRSISLMLAQTCLVTAGRVSRRLEVKHLSNDRFVFLLEHVGLTESVRHRNPHRSVSVCGGVRTMAGLVKDSWYANVASSGCQPVKECHNPRSCVKIWMAECTLAQYNQRTRLPSLHFSHCFRWRGFIPLFYPVRGTEA